ncbi:MAG: BA14K family protein [Rhodopseudomonas sp.]|uniref:BA14K family protein n=1 Tax=Rhodopseudomonas sp. TaxID=1078 RepID=UPI0018162808|nr:BA14K family protein [Rhodopseudomonas sp.]NVN86103.1 BA14K family protein [Rhodopseudomonas sp.]
MTIQKSGGSVRKLVTRVLASAVLLSVYMLGLVATTGAVMTAGITPAHAQRGRGRGWGGRGRGWGGPGVGAAIGLGIGAAMIGGAIAASEAQRSNAVGYCMQRYRSYDPASGTFVGRDGLRHPCP